MTEQERYRKAREQVCRVKDFYAHFTVYVLVNVFLLALNLITSPGSLWFYWPLLGWGIAIAIHAAYVFGVPGIYTRSEE